jgi:hypothetical protein
VRRGDQPVVGLPPAASSGPAVAAALEAAGVPHSDRFTDAFAFRCCRRCGERNVVRGGDLTCAVCEAGLAAAWNVDDPRQTGAASG